MVDEELVVEVRVRGSGCGVDGSEEEEEESQDIGSSVERVAPGRCRNGIWLV